MSLISRCIGRTHDGAGVYEVGEPARYVCGWTTGHVLRMGPEATFATREAAELAWEIAPTAMRWPTMTDDTIVALTPGLRRVWEEAYNL